MLRRNSPFLALLAPLLAACAAAEVPPSAAVAPVEPRPHIVANQQAKLVDLARCHSQAQELIGAGPEDSAYGAEVDHCMRSMGYSRGDVAERPPPRARSPS